MAEAVFFVSLVIAGVALAEVLARGLDSVFAAMSGEDED